MSEQDNGSALIQSGTAEGLIEFLDYVVAKGYGPATAAGPQKSAVRQVMTVTEGENFGSFDIRNGDVDDLLQRFEVRARGDLKAESIHSYKSRFMRAVESYRKFLDTGTPPKYRQTTRRSASSDGVNRRKAAPPPAAAAPTPSAAGAPPGERMVDYPFPLRSGGLANFRLPVNLDRADAERMAHFLRALVSDQPKQLSAGEPQE
jgi:hypothetical protein